MPSAAEAVCAAVGQTANENAAMKMCREWRIMMQRDAMELLPKMKA